MMPTGIHGGKAETNGPMNMMPTSIHGARLSFKLVAKLCLLYIDA
jgi:hypothetical protein